MENTKFNYTPNIRYIYEYSSHIRSEFNGSGQNSSDIYVLGTVELTFPKKCEGSMRIIDVELRERSIEYEANDEYNSDESADSLHIRSTEFALDVQKNNLR